MSAILEMTGEQRLETPYTVEVGDVVFRLVDFKREWSISQSAEVMKVIRKVRKESSDTSFGGGGMDTVVAIVDMLGALAELELVTKVAALFFVPKSQASWKKSKMDDNAALLEELPTEAMIEAFQRFFSSSLFASLGVSLTSTQQTVETTKVEAGRVEADSMNGSPVSPTTDTE